MHQAAGMWTRRPTLSLYERWKFEFRSLTKFRLRRDAFHRHQLPRVVVVEVEPDLWVLSSNECREQKSRLEVRSSFCGGWKEEKKKCSNFFFIMPIFWPYDRDTRWTMCSFFSLHSSSLPVFCHTLFGLSHLDAHLVFSQFSNYVNNELVWSLRAYGTYVLLRIPLGEWFFYLFKHNRPSTTISIPFAPDPPPVKSSKNWYIVLWDAGPSFRRSTHISPFLLLYQGFALFAYIL